MRLVRPVLFLLIVCCTVNLYAQLPATPDGVKQPRILILLDGSSSMLNAWGKSDQRFTAAARVVSALMDSIYRVNNQVEFALRVYGHQYPAQENNCTDTRREVMFSKDNYTQMALRLASLHPRGVSPIAYALKEAATTDLQDELHNAYSIILITDGGESCNGNICEVVSTLISRKIFFKPYIISMMDYEPLRSQYACLGNYLTVAREDDIAPAVSSIVSDYRPMLKSPILVADKPEAPKPRQPDIQVVTIPQWIPEHTNVNTLQVVVKDKMPETFHYNRSILPAAKSDIKPATIDPALPDPAALAATPAKTSLPAGQRTAPVVGSKIATTPVAVIPRPAADTPRPAAVVPKPKPAADTARTSVVIKALPPALAAKPKPEDNKPRELAFTSSSENATEKGTRIYFTDGHGKFYKTTPRLQLTDAKGNVVKQFFRTVDAAGNPDLLQLPGGTYSLVVPGRRNAVLRNVTIQADKLNKLVVVVNNGSLAFEYEGAPGRPVEEFEARVNILFEPGPTITQKCALELEYTPGNYHIELNTLPPRIFNTDIDFASVTLLTIPQPGFVHFTNSTPVGKVALYCPLGDRFNRFYIMDLNGDPASQKLRLQPGTYEVHWVKKPSAPMGTETVQRFLVKSNAVTEIELH